MSAGGGLRPSHLQYRLRPETLESLYYMYRVTGEQKYRDWSWEIFEAINRTAKTEYGFAKITDVTRAVGSAIPSYLEDSQETFMGAETLKYALLIHLPAEALPLEKFVFNTEAHPFPVFSNDAAKPL